MSNSSHRLSVPPLHGLPIRALALRAYLRLLLRHVIHAGEKSRPTKHIMAIAPRVRSSVSSGNGSARTVSRCMAIGFLTGRSRNDPPPSNVVRLTNSSELCSIALRMRIVCWLQGDVEWRRNRIGTVSKTLY